MGNLIPGVAPEHYHPLIVHFPIALWTVGTALYIVSMMGYLRWLRTPSVIVGLIGCGFGWLSVESGKIAARVAILTLCDSSLMRDHAENAESALIFFGVAWSLATLFQIIQTKLSKGRESPFIVRLLLCGGLIMGCVFLAMAGHKGFQLVFENGAAVKVPVRHCNNPGSGI